MTKVAVYRGPFEWKMRSMKAWYLYVPTDNNFGFNPNKLHAFRVVTLEAGPDACLMRGE